MVAELLGSQEGAPEETRLLIFKCSFINTLLDSNKLLTQKWTDSKIGWLDGGDQPA